MSRSGYDEGCDYDWDLIRWRGAVASALRGKRGQAFLREMLVSMDALPTPELIVGELVEDGAVCAIGSVALTRGTFLGGIDPEDREAIADTFGIAGAMAAEIMFMNDEGGRHSETRRQRWERMRCWAINALTSDMPTAEPPQPSPSKRQRHGSPETDTA